MKRLDRLILPAFVAALLIGGILTGCTTAQQAATANAFATAAAACQAAQPVVAAVPLAIGSASADVQAKVASLVTYEQSVCASSATLAAAASQSGNTQAWIMNIASGIVSLLPAVLPLL